MSEEEEKMIRAMILRWSIPEAVVGSIVENPWMGAGKYGRQIEVTVELIQKYYPEYKLDFDLIEKYKVMNLKRRGKDGK